LISKKPKEWYRNLNQLSGKRLDILKNALGTFAETRASQSAASLAYYAFFSLFPLLLVIIAGGSYFLNSQQVYQDVIQLVQRAIPVSTRVISENLFEVLDERETVGILSLLTLLWSASGVFTNLAYSINLAWPSASRRNFFKKRLVGLAMIAGVSGLMVLSLALNWVINMVPILKFAIVSFPDLNLWSFFSSLGSWLVIFLLFLVLYRWVPTAEVNWNATLWGALIASIAWKIAGAGFSWYLKSGAVRYQSVYGSLGAIVALLFLIFIGSLITLFGAHLSAAIDRWIKENNPIQ